MSPKKPVDILHVYPGASGLAGTYLSEIMNALKPDMSQAAFAGYYYRAQDAFKIFYPTTDFSGKNFFYDFL